MSNLHVVVGGAQPLAKALETTGNFVQVHTAASTQELLGVLSGGLKGVKKTDVVFVFADNLTENAPKPSFRDIVQKLSSTGWKVILLSITGKADELTSSFPSVGKLSAAGLTANLMLGAIKAVGFPIPGPHPSGNEVLDLTGWGSVPKAAEPEPVQLGGWSTPQDSGWSTPPAQPAPAAEPAWNPASAPEANSGWAQEPESNSNWGATPAQTAAPEAWAPQQEENNWNQAPAAEQGWPSQNGEGLNWNQPDQSTQNNGWGQEPANDWGQAPQQGQASQQGWGQEPANGWGQAPQQGWGQEAQQNNGWGQEPANDWGQAPQQGWGEESFAPSNQPWADTQEAAPSRRALSSFVDAPEDAFMPAQNGFDPSWQPEGQVGGIASRVGSYQAQHDEQRHGKVITISVPKGGTGKSTLTLNLAVFLALTLRQEGKRVCVIDTNIQQADTAKYIGSFHPTIMNVAQDPTLLTRDRINQALVHRTDLGISALLGPATPDEGNPAWITPNLYSEITELLKEQFDYIFIDTPVAEKYHRLFQEYALPEADFIVVPVAPNMATLHNTDSWLRQAVTAPKYVNGGMGIPADRIGVVLNRAKDNIDCSEDDVRANLAQWPFLGSIPETDEWQRYNNNYDIIATANYAELDEAFAQVLYEVTHEPALLQNFQQNPIVKKGFSAKIKALIGGKR